MKKLTKIRIFFTVIVLFLIIYYYFPFSIKISNHWKKTLIKNQETFLNNVDNIDVIEQEMNKFYSNKTKERAIVFCFDNKKKLIYCDKNNKYHFIDVTKPGTSTEKSVKIDLSKILNLFDFNGPKKYFVEVHNHPNFVGLPSDTDIKNGKSIDKFLLLPFYSRPIFDKNLFWFNLVWTKPGNLTNDYSVNNYPQEIYEPSSIQVKDINAFFDIKKNYTVYNLQE